METDSITDILSRFGHCYAVYNCIFLYKSMELNILFSPFQALALLMKQAVRPDSPLKGHERTVLYLQHLGMFQLQKCITLNMA